MTNATVAPAGVDASPFDLQPGRPVDGVAALCIHGLTGTPYEVRPLAEALSRAGVRAVGVLLPGHNSSAEALSRTRYVDWLTSARHAYARLAADYDHVFVVGLSLGGLLALSVAASERVAGVVAVGTPLRLAQPIPLLVPIVKYLMPMLPKREGSDIRDAAARARHPGYREMPLRSVHELLRLQSHVRGWLPDISAPALIAHGAHDRTADPADAERICSAIGSTDREVLVLERSGHVVPVDYDGEVLSQRVADFVSQRIPARSDAPDAPSTR